MYTYKNENKTMATAANSLLTHSLFHPSGFPPKSFGTILKE